MIYYVVVIFSVGACKLKIKQVGEEYKQVAIKALIYYVCTDGELLQNRSMHIYIRNICEYVYARFVDGFENKISCTIHRFCVRNNCACLEPIDNIPRT